VHVADVPDCVGPGVPKDVDDGLTETLVVGTEVGVGVSTASTNTRTQYDISVRRLLHAFVKDGFHAMKDA
jgi:hypothetical protein